MAGIPGEIDATWCVLEPLRVDHAAEMVAVLADEDLYTFIGGSPPSLGDLQRRYAAMVVGHSPDGAEEWLNWIIRLRGAGSPAIGTVQATVTKDGRHADVAWVVGSGYQGRGYACAAARAMVSALIADGVTRVTAHVHPDHPASAAVARSCGLRPTAAMHGGERRWEWKSAIQPSGGG